tara:strand:- start:10 stop:609 length:600 start_codon:yes stop_codon:yes gene_type:complete
MNNLQIAFNQYAINYTVGLLGGSFNPPHLGHVHISKLAIRKFGLSEIFWIYTKRNPLKAKIPESIENRLKKSIKLVSDPRIKFSDLELKNHFHYSVEMLQYLKRKNSRTNFIWIMGEDSLLYFHLWKNWEWIANNYKIGVLARDNSRAAVNSSVFASKFKHFRLHSSNSIALMSAKAPAWCLVNTKKRRVSSSDLRSDV